MQLNGSDILMEVLIEQEVDTIFGYPGGAVLHIYDALYKYKDKIRHIMPVDECGAGHAADGYARASGKTGVVLATSGPGATNLVTALATAYMDSIPVVAITGNVPTNLIGKDSFQEVYITGITMPITKHNFVVRDVKELADTVRQAFLIANQGRKGPVLVDIPKDISGAFCDFERKAKKQPKKYRIDSSLQKNIQDVAELINNSKRPLVYFGGGTRDYTGILREFLQNTNIPCVHTIMATGNISYDEPFYVGLIGMHGTVTSNTIINEADLILAIGTRFSDRVALNTSKFGGEAKKVHIDIDQSEVNKNVKVDYELIGDLEEILKAFLILKCKSNSKEWLSYIKDMKEKEEERLKNKFAPKEFSPKNIMDTINEVTKSEAICVTDVGQHQMWAVQYTKHRFPRSFLTSGGLGTMGFAYGAALGAKIAKPEKTVIQITGDGSFYMNLNEVATAVEYSLPIISIILNNNTLGMVRQWQSSFYENRYSSTDMNKKMDYVKVAQGFYAKGFSCKNLNEFKEAFSEALKEKNTPVWIECIIDKDEKVLPMIPAGGNVENIIVD
ncbi:biosynthetic-type acetolactate synthase large subunit [uncultured Campylobacter sp.]|uniref:biosynthetic-type acetolactate synthase large subunit n=1 Tax=uncultured Campylobacter sp. TaxID=218934 RepID=UPI0026107375|nr:biosynthetic-type acetolactate synthase large subunit [uncultured Campylobacter sp.]